MAKKKQPQDESLPKATTFFDLLNYLTYLKKPYDSLTEQERKLISPYMLNRFISMNIDLIDIVSEFQKYTIGVLNNAEVYKLYLDILPKERLFFKYVKGSNEDKYDTVLIQCVKNLYSVSSYEAIEYLEVIKSANNLKDFADDILIRNGINDSDRLKIIKGL